MTVTAAPPPARPATTTRSRLSDAVAAAGLAEGDRVLLMGTGVEAAIVTAAAAVGMTGRAVGLAPEAARRAAGQRRLWDGGWHQARLVDGDPERIPLADGWADAVVACMDRPPADPRARELMRVLRPGGRLVLAGPALGGGGAPAIDIAAVAAA